jgi:hypothetical protein
VGLGLWGRGRISWGGGEVGVAVYMEGGRC